MQVINSPHEMQLFTLQCRAQGQRIAFVPTMGALHEGHLSLLREGRRRGDILVLSIYVNPTQFAPTEDLSRYPRPLGKDLELAKEVGTDIVFTPTDEAMYPKGYQTYVEVEGVTKGLCGAARPAHFKGVTTIVQKLFNIVQPDMAIFGEKDYQQLITIKTMVRDLNIPVEIVGMPIVREKDGLAISSRNIYLSKEERTAALSISRGLKAAQETIANGEKDSVKIIAVVQKIIGAARLLKIDYIKLCNAETLEELTSYKPPARLLAAVFVGKTRLIDNC